MKIGLACDHAGFKYKEKLKELKYHLYYLRMINYLKTYIC